MTVEELQAAPETKPSIFLGIPTYNGQIHASIDDAILELRTVYPTMKRVVGGSLLAYQFNCLWLMALETKADFFLMCHADIVPQAGALQKLIEECIELDADVVSAVAPIKTQDGITSTAVADKGSLWRPRRFTMREVYTFPETFDAAAAGEPGKALLINTGLMVCNLKRRWAKSACFTIRDRIVKRDGKREPVVLPEDWGFSWFLHQRGAKVYATRKVLLDHHGSMAFPNNQAWGTAEHDPAHPELFPTVELGVIAEVEKEAAA